ncbi:uncharacterized protein LOC119724068 [Patiria miniata]|uniref:Uncharacterized protein n=1 Tax=Patiria miniata TaxID=46514 RepID=A0A913ZIP4_PATMI|nr:uncharacterized protein LOC119722591 [Patiria miniata]XP_038049661.1 uncharacterized protein LOC119723171 [Patiria miniata]XP_038050915.1 uncharacterized protein LOC119724068 [Patiria miniata]
MLQILLACLMLVVSRVESNWNAEESDSSKAKMGFSRINMTCNDAEDVCQHCVIIPLFGQEFLTVVEYTKDPYQLEVSVQEGRQSRDWTFSQDDLAGKYRWCESAYSEASWDYDHSWRYTICYENIFDDISVPEDCAKPLAVVTHESHYYDDEVRGQQMLFCLP